MTTAQEYLEKRWTALILLWSAFLGGAVIAALGVVATLVLIRTRDSKAHVEMSKAEASQAEAAPVGA